MNATIRQLLNTAGLLLADVGGPTTAGPVTVLPASPTVLTATTASRCRGAAFALRAALEGAVVDRLTVHGAPRAICEGSKRPCPSGSTNSVTGEAVTGRSGGSRGAAGRTRTRACLSG
ncbi:hypothetical protein JIX56_26900 [Streptomyces sp. CA-210063]|uniref:hypothetical protein n=1 Tax=Streptomyces sp. CA-210063 TaxID=2801029 RepID=UPI00214C5E55|nr:hypothetical protein [Streptomyces sp. CA-210063]UUU33204.1 hypothetical protein JIX56_26900 [Streptomyces sp. CA-210063]